MTFIAGVEKSIIKSTKNTRPQVAKGIVKKKSNFGGIPILVSKFILQSYNNKSSMILAGKRHE
jgi:hypothetical protein